MAFLRRVAPRLAGVEFFRMRSTSKRGTSWKAGGPASCVSVPDVLCTPEGAASSWYKSGSSSRLASGAGRRSGRGRLYQLYAYSAAMAAPGAFF